jgi:hypothetical protein
MKPPSPPRGESLNDTHSPLARARNCYQSRSLRRCGDALLK